MSDPKKERGGKGGKGGKGWGWNYQRHGILLTGGSLED